MLFYNVIDKNFIKHVPFKILCFKDLIKSGQDLIKRCISGYNNLIKYNLSYFIKIESENNKIL